MVVSLKSVVDGQIARAKHKAKPKKDQQSQHWIDKYASIIKKTNRDLEAAAWRYAQADKSDPFAYSRAMCHLKNGIASLRPDGEDAFYDATPSTETRILPPTIDRPEPLEYQVTIYKDAKRP